MSSQEFTYAVVYSTLVRFETEPTGDFHPASPDEVLGWVRDTVQPAVDAAKVVLEKVKETRPNEVELRFGIKVSGTANWLVAKAASEGNFEVTLRWTAGTNLQDEIS